MSAFCRFFSAVICFVLPFTSNAQEINPALQQDPWSAQWITGPGAPLNMWTAYSEPGLKDYGVYKFRKALELSQKPVSFIVHVSADNRYKLFVNGKQVSQGPARGDLYFWNFETVDLAPYLQPGKNIIAALVWNEGRLKPEAQITNFTGFILQGNTQTEEAINTNNSWKAVKDSSYQQLTVRVPGYYVAGPAEYVNMKFHVKGWLQTDYDDHSWNQARAVGPGMTKDAAIDARGWMLVPSPLPPMEMATQRLVSVRKAEGVKVPSSFPTTRTAITIAAHTQASLLLDQGYNTNAYPTLVFSRGKNASISIGYAEALYIHKDENLSGYWIPTLPKGNRNDVEGKIFLGKRDSILSDGGVGQEFTPLWWRTYRYIQLTVHTQEEPIVLDDIYGTFTGYPFQNNSKLQVDDSEFSKILQIGWRTARLCAFETYMDCPYYEQLQYIGDARIQALVSFYNSGDDRLVRNALTLMDHSRIAEGITLSRYPTDLHQQIPTFSLWWIGMLHDYWMYRSDSNFIKDKLPGERQVLSFFERYQQPDGSLKDVPYWNFTDWVEGKKGWNRGMAPVGQKGESAVLDLQLMWTYLIAAEMEKRLGLMDFSRLYSSRAALLKQTIQQKYWDESKGLYADTEAKDLFSQHANALAILSGMISGEKATALAKKTMIDTTLAPSSIYFKYYLHQAAVKAGLGDDYLSWLDKWRENIKMGMTTWGETSDVNTTRSDCHAWGSSPNVEFFRTILGIDSDAPGFSQVRIEPHLGAIKNISGVMPHPNGNIAVQYVNKKGKWHIEISLPEHTTGYLIWKGQRYDLKSGKNHVSPVPEVTKVAQTEAGAVSGVVNKEGNVVAYKGIPFAAPPVGTLRWKAPQPVQHWNGVRKCENFGPSPMQNKPAPFSMWSEEFLIPKEPISEDCLYLNVWTNAASSNEKRPVLVWIYGGGFNSGGSAVPIYDGEAMAKKGIVFVSINYRVGIFGFLAHPELTKESPENISGNYGLLDQIAALQWVQKNITAFGGNPNNVTIAGQSAGSMSVNYLVASPRAKGLFQRAIAESGANFTRGSASLQQAEEDGVKIAKGLNLLTVADLRKVPAEELQRQAQGQFRPIIDGLVLPHTVADIFAAGKQNNVDLLTGWNEEEGLTSGPIKNAADFRLQIAQQFGADSATVFQFYPANSETEAVQSQLKLSRDMMFGVQNYTWANVQSGQGKRVYVYRFTRKVPATGEYKKYGAFHTGEVPYAYDNLQFVNRPWETADQQLAKVMSSYWVNFVATGNPNGKKLPQWPVYTVNDKQIMKLDVMQEAKHMYDARALDFLYQKTSKK